MSVVREGVDGEARTVRLVLGEDELVLIANALNEVANGVHIEEAEFVTRLGADRAEAQELLAAVGAALDALPARS